MDLIRNSFEAGELAPALTGRTALRQYPRGCRTIENCVVLSGSGGAERRPGLEIIRETITTPRVPEVPAVPATYTYTWFSDNGAIWGVPVFDGVISCLDASPVRNVGGGVIGFPFTSHPFVTGDQIEIYGTTNYDGLYTVAAGTTANEIQIVYGYTAETFDGTETVIRKIGGLASGAGRMVRDSSDNLYYGHGWSAGLGTAITKIASDGTITYDDFTWPDTPTGRTVLGLVLSADESSLYVSMEHKVYKFDMATGVADWSTAQGNAGFELALDADDNAYLPYEINGGVRKYAAATGLESTLTLMGQTKNANIVESICYAIAVDQDAGVVMAGGNAYTTVGAQVANMYNLCARTTDNAAGYQMALGGTYLDGITYKTYNISSGCIVAHGSYFYVLLQPTSSSSTISKLQWNGSAIVTIATAAGPDHGCGLYFDLYDNLVVVNQRGADTDILWFYDTDLTYLTKVDGLYQILTNWEAIGGAWSQGNVYPNGDLGTPAIPAVPAVDTTLPLEL